MKRILVVDGDTGVRARIAKHARMEGYDVTEAGDGETALSLSRQQNAFDLMVLAVNLPGMDGFTVLKAVRTFSAIPVLILSSKNTAEDRIHGLELGADDYMTKPFNPLELVARVKTQLRRYTTYNAAAENQKQVYDFAGLYICRDSRKCSLYGRELSFTPLEFDILWYLCAHRGAVVSSEVLFEAVWGEKYLDNNNTVMAHIARIREKMGEPSRKPRFIKTVWGVGYTIE